jgi:predicted histidine transporter YuiF (NhaC family)
MVIKVLYCVFLGALVVLFVGWLLAALLPTPDWDSEYPGRARWYESPSPDKPTAEELAGLSLAERKAKFQDYEAKRKKYEASEKEQQKMENAFSKKVEKRDRNVSLISLLIAIVVVALTVGLSGRLPVMSEGLLLGGLFTLIYSIGFSFVRSPKIAVIPVGVGLIVTIALGYKRFVQATNR